MGYDESEGEATRVTLSTPWVPSSPNVAPSRSPGFSVAGIRGPQSPAIRSARREELAQVDPEEASGDQSERREGRVPGDRHPCCGLDDRRNPRSRPSASRGVPGP